MLITNGGHIETDDGTPSNDVPSQRQWARIFEMTYANTQRPEKVFEVTCDSGLGSRYGWSIYRAQRIGKGFVDLNITARSPDQPGHVYPRLPAVKKP